MKNSHIIFEYHCCLEFLNNSSRGFLNSHTLSINVDLRGLLVIVDQISAPVIVEFLLRQVLASYLISVI